VLIFVSGHKTDDDDDADDDDTSGTGQMLCLWETRHAVPKRSKIIYLPCLQIYSRPPVTLTFYPKSTLHTLVTWTTCQFTLKSVHSFSEYNVHNLAIDGRINDRTKELTR